MNLDGVGDESIASNWCGVLTALQKHIILFKISIEFLLTMVQQI